MQTLADHRQFIICLKKAGFRSSKARLQVFDCLLEASEPLSIQQIIKTIPDIHFVSIYRALEVLVKIKVLKQVPIGLKYKYELSDDFKPHHHHVICEKCGQSFKIASQEIENMMDEVTIEFGLKPTKHYFEAYGVCSRH